MRKTIPASLAALALLALLALLAPRAGAATAADECVAAYRTEQASGLDFELQNNCDKNLSCSIGWTLTCENASGKVTSRTRAGVRFAVTASTAHHELGSAAACKGNWRIDDVSWDCAPIK